MRRLGWLGIAIATIASCSKTSDNPRPTVTTATPPPPPPPLVTPPRPPPPRDVDHPETWRASAEACPLAMTTIPAPKPGQTLGEAAIAQGRSESQIDLTLVKAFPSAFTPSTRTDDVPVVYVETSRTEPALADRGARVFQPGSSIGTAYVFSRAANKFACMASIHATSSPSVTSVDPDDSATVAWLEMDLQAAIEREVATNARVIVATPSGSSLSPRVDPRFHVRLLLPPDTTAEEYPISTLYSSKVGGEVGVMIKSQPAGIHSLEEAVRESTPSSDFVVEAKRALGKGRFYVRSAASGLIHHTDVFFDTIEVDCQSTDAGMVALLDRICLSAEPEPRN